MTRIVGSLLRGFGPQPTVVPAVPSLTIADNGDGTGAVATISGSTPGATNTVYVAHWSSALGSIVWTAAGSRSGNGTVALSVPPGIYLAYCESAIDSQAVTGVVNFRATSPLAGNDGSLALALAGAEELFSRSPTFQTLANKTAEGLKAQHIYFGRHELSPNCEPGQTLGEGADPVVILHTGFHGYSAVGEGVAYTLANDGGIAVEFVMRPGRDEAYKESYLRFVDFMSRVLDEVAELVGVDTLFPFNQFELLQEPIRPSIAERGSDDFWVAVYLLRYEVEG